MLEDTFAEGVAGGERVVALVPAQAVRDALARLGREALQDLVRRKPAQLDEHGAHLVAAYLGFRQEVVELAFVDDALGAK